MEIKTAVEAVLDPARPQYRVGSDKWRAVNKWGFWIDTFSAVCNSDNMSFQVSPIEYFDALREAPREMAILASVQRWMREKVAKDREARQDKQKQPQAAARPRWFGRSR